jgi:hypothetical protein
MTMPNPNSKSKAVRTAKSLVKKSLEGKDATERAKALFRFLMEIEDEFCEAKVRVPEIVEAALTAANKLCPKEV